MLKSDNSAMLSGLIKGIPDAVVGVFVAVGITGKPLPYQPTHYRQDT